MFSIKKRQLQVGVITVIHTFGRDLKFNPHVHTLVTEETLDNRHEWRPSDYISYDYLLNRKEKPAVKQMREAFDRDPFRCLCCQQEMELTEIWHVRYGYLYHYLEDVDWIQR